MTTWNQCSEYYTKVFDSLQEYARTNLKQVKDDSIRKNISVHILEKIHINLINCLDILPKVEKHPLNFLSLGLILRGMLSDLINYRYLDFVYRTFGKEDFENEVKLLELDFVRTYKSMVDNERKMAEGDDAKQKEIDDTFRKNFAEFHNDAGLKKPKDFQSREFHEKIHKFAHDNSIELTSRINTDATKIQVVKDNNTEKIQILYSYLSTLQHFSGRAYNFYKTKEYLDFNAHLTMMHLFFTTLAILSIVKSFNEKDEYLEVFVKLTEEIAEL